MKKLVILVIVVLSSYRFLMAQKGTDDLFLRNVLSSEICFSNKQMAIDTLPWHPHVKFKGVYLKHLILGEDTQKQVSCHIVKIEPYGVLDTHVHEGRIEIHEVIAGSGAFYLYSKEVAYTQGTISVIPANAPHKLVAGKEGIYLFAKFTPALQ